MAGGKTIYCCDTSSLIHAWHRAYPPKRFPGLWKQLEQLIEEGRLIASIEVLNELKKKEDGLADWAALHKGMFQEIDDDVQGHVISIMAGFPKLVDTGKGKSGADPFVIAQALAGRPPHTVVTQEAGGTADKPRIPFVCRESGLTVIDILALIDQEDWSF